MKKIMKTFTRPLITLLIAGWFALIPVGVAAHNGEVDTPQVVTTAQVTWIGGAIERIYIETLAGEQIEVTEAELRNMQPVSGKIVYENLYNNIDLILYPKVGAACDFELVVYPGGNPNEIQMAFQGQTSVRTLQDGSVKTTGTRGGLLTAASLAYQFDGWGEEVAVPCQYRVHGNVVGVSLPQYEQASALNIRINQELLSHSETSAAFYTLQP